MAIGTKLVFDVNNNVEDFTFILSTRDYRHLGALQNVTPESVTNKGNLNSANECSFEVYKVVTKDGENIEEPLWDDIENFKLVYVRELDEYFEINISLEDSIENVKKTITLTSLCEAELSQYNINDLEINSESDISRPDYEPTIFCNSENHNTSLLHRVLSFAPNYTIKHVDESLINIQRTFSVSGTTVYNWLVGECAEEFHCLFQFDSTDRSISVYDLYAVCKDCGHRTDPNAFADDGTNDYICPKCGSENVKYFGTDTTIYIDKENLTDSIQFTTDTDSVKNCFKLVAGDDLMTAIVRSLNMNGTDYIINIPDYQKKDMAEELVVKYEEYDALYLSKQEEYEQLVLDMYSAQSEINKLKHTMFPTIEQAEVTVQTEADKLTQANLSPLAIYPFTTSTSIATVESALINYAKIYVKTGYVKLAINDSSYSYIGTDNDGNAYGIWRGNFKVTNYSNEEDIAYSETVTVKVYGDYEEFLEQKVMKSIIGDDDESSVFDVLSIEDLDDFKAAITYYNLTSLKSFYSSIQSAMTVLMPVDQASEGADFYKTLYLPYYEKSIACQEEIDKRQASIDEWTATYDNIVEKQEAIQKELNFRDYLGEDLYKIFYSYRREDTYQNDNYKAEGLSDEEAIALAKEFIENAKQELVKASTQVHSISSTLYNLLLISEFKPIIDMFELGNWIRIRVDDDIYRLRLIGYSLSFSSIQTLEVEFSDVTKLHSVNSEVGDILNSAKSMSSSYAYVSNQASNGSEASATLNNWVEDSLNTALVGIKNNNNEEIVFDEHGLWARSFDEITGNYAPEQLRITHNILCFTEDNWKTVSLGLGKHEYVYFDGNKFITAIGYGLSAKFLQAPYVYGGQLISGDIYSDNYSPITGKGAHLALNNGSFTLADSKIVYDADTNVLNLKGVTLDWNTTTSPTVDDVDGLNEKLDEINDSLTSMDEEFANELTNYVSNTVFNGSVAELQSQIDGNITTWFEDGTPSLNAYPSNEWITIEDRNKHLGDLYYDNLTGYAYRFQLNGTTYEWVKITDTDVVKALADAKNAQDTADSKRRVFVTTPIPPYDEGDLWTQGEDGDILRCATARTSDESFTRSDWVLTCKYTDDTELYTFINGEFQDTIDAIKTQSDQKAETWYQKADPSTSWTDEEKETHVGDLWYSTSDEKIYIWNGKSWDETKSTPPSEVFDEIDGKAQIFISQPTTPYREGDLWFNSESSDIMTCVKDRLDGDFVSSDWEKRNKYTDDSVLTNFINGDYAEALKDINTQIDGKARAWYQSEDPSLTWDTTEDHEGDLWYDTDANSQVTSIYVNGAWKATSVPKEIFDTIDGIASIYVTIPDNPVSGDLLIPTSDIDGTDYKAGKVYRYNGTAWVEINYTDDTKANEALDAATKAQTTADSAKSVAENAETIGNNLVNVLGYDGTKITGTYIYSPVISGGSILVGDKSGTYAQITPEGILNCAGANVSGDITATSLTLGSDVYISSNNVSGLSTVATSGKYSDLSGTPTIPTSITDLTGSADILYADDVSISSTTSTNGVTTQSITVGDKTYTSITNGDFVLTNVGLGTDTEDGSESYTHISKDGLLIAKNAVVYGDVYATNGKFSGIINAKEGGTIGGFTIGEKAIYNDTNSLTSTTSGIYLGTDGIYNYQSSTVYTKIANGQMITTSGSIGGININQNGIYYSGTSTTDGFGLWKANYHTVGGKSIIMHAGGNNSNIGGAKFILYQDGSFYASSATIKGAITATSGTLDTVTATNLTVTSGEIKLGDVTISSTNGLVVSGTKNTGGSYSKLGCVSVDNNSLFIGSWGTNSSPSVFMCKGSSTSVDLGGSGLINGWAFGAGTKFGVTNTGAVYCSDATITGGSLTLSSSTSSGVKVKVYYSNASSIYSTLSPDGLIVCAGGVTSIIAGASITTAGSKPRMVTTENYNTRMLYCYETPTPMFGDLGEGQLDETGVCYIFIDDIFSETIDRDYNYQVFLQKYGEGDCWVSERNNTYFIVKGTPSLKFGWELKTIQFDAVNKRLELIEQELGSIVDENLNTSDGEESLNSYIDSLLDNSESEE